jgi:hypothetical protein
MYLRILLPFAVAIGVAGASQAAIIVTAGNHVLQPNTPGQAINILITATEGEAVHSMDFAAGINGGGGPAPIITDIDVNGAGSLFDTSVNTSMVFTFGPGFDPPGLEVLERVEFDSDDLNVPIGTNQLLAQLIIDTTDFAAGQWALDLLHTGFDQLSLFAIEEGLSVALPVTLVSGTITIVPEPASWALCCLSLGVLVATNAARRRRSAQCATA